MIILKEGGQITEYYDRYGMVRPTNLCQLVNKTFWTAVALTGFFSLIPLGLFGAVWVFFDHSHWTCIVFGLEMTVAIVVGSCLFYNKYRLKHPKPEKVESQWRANLREAWRGWKDKFCPLIKYE